MKIEINYLVPTTIFTEVDDKFEALKKRDIPELEEELRKIALDEMRSLGDGGCDLESICDENSGEPLYEE